MDLRGQGPPCNKKVGFEALARAKTCMQPANDVIGRTPCLLPVVVSPFVGARHVAYIAHAAAAGPGPVAYVLLVRGSSQGLVDPAVRVCVYRHVVR